MVTLIEPAAHWVTLDPALPPLPAGRLTEVCGNAATAFAALAAARQPGPVVWIVPRRSVAGMPHATGLAPFIDPSRLCFVWVSTAQELLWSTEEALRSGSPGTVVAEPVKRPSLTETRRLQLAAEKGQTLGLILSHDRHPGINAATMRWISDAMPSDDWDSTPWIWRLDKNKMGTSSKSWKVVWHGQTRTLHVVSEICERPALPSAGLSP